MRVEPATLMREWCLFEFVGLVEQPSKVNTPLTANKYLINDFMPLIKMP
jgi:hypothetical protein